MDRFRGASKVDAHCIPVHFVIGGRRTSAAQTTSMFAGARRFPLSFRGPTSANKKVAGYGRLRRPPSQPVTSGRGRGGKVVGWKVAEPGSPSVGPVQQLLNRYMTCVQRHTARK